MSNCASSFRAVSHANLYGPGRAKPQTLNPNYKFSKKKTVFNSFIRLYCTCDVLQVVDITSAMSFALQRTMNAANSAYIQYKDGLYN